MAFSQATILGQPTIRVVGVDLVVTWLSSSPEGTVYQVYLNRVLAWSGTIRRAVFPVPHDKVTIDVGTVGANEGAVDYSASLSTDDDEPPDRVKLEWLGGTFMGDDLDHFNIYSSFASLPPAPVSFVEPLDTVPFGVAGADQSGWGQGPYNAGGWGHSATRFTWTSKKLSTGSWTFSVVGVDEAGNMLTSPLTTTITVIAAPAPPLPFSDGKRLRYTYDANTRIPTLIWQASPY